MNERRPPSTLRRTARFVLAGLLGTGLALLVACGSSSRSLIPSGQAGPLLGDFEAVQRAAEKGGGECAATDAALSKTEKDFARLPSSLNSGLRTSLRQGIENLSARAHELCTQPPTQGTTTGTSTSTTTSPGTTSSTTPTNTTPTTKQTEEGESQERSGPGGASPEEQQKTHENSGGAESEERSPGGESGGGAGGGAGGAESPK